MQCLECGSVKVWKDGLRYRKGSSPIQRYLCRSCGYRFSESTVKLDVTSQVLKRSKPRNDLTHNVVPSLNFPLKETRDNFPLLRSENVASHKRTVIGQRLNTFRDYNSTHRVCAEENEAKNLVKVQPQTEKAGAGATPADIKGKLVEFAWWLKKEGYKDSTIHMRSRNLKRLVKLGANLYDPENIKEIIANQSSWNVNTKANIVDTYNTFTRMLDLSWNPPRYKEERSFPFIPTEQEIDSLIACCGNKTATFLQVLKETGMRAGEAFSLKWVDIDTERHLMNLRHPEKGSNPRIFKVSIKLVGMVNQLPRKSTKVFGDSTLKSLRSSFCASRKKAVRKLANPRLLEIHFHTLRHWKATMEYHKTKDIMHVKSMLGHKRIDNTQIYINLEQAIFSEGDNSEYTTRVAKTVRAARALLEAGFEYVTDMDGFKLFRKRS